MSDEKTCKYCKWLNTGDREEGLMYVRATKYHCDKHNRYVYDDARCSEWVEI